MARLRKTRKIQHHRPISLYGLVILATLASASPDCARFSFHSFQNNKVDKISWKEHTTMTLPFALNINKCPQDNDKSHFVYVAQSSGKFATDVEFCAIRLTHEVCFSYKPQNCRCVGERGRWQVVFEKVMTKSDTGSWLWQTGDGLTETIYFDVQPDTSKKDNALASPEAVEDKLAKKKSASDAASDQERSDDSNGSDRGSPDVAINPGSRPKEHIHTSRNEEQKTPTKIRPILADYIENDDEKDERDSNPVHDEVKVSDDDDDDDDDNDDDSFGNSLTTGVVVGTMNVISIVVVLVIVFVCRKRKERRGRESPECKPPPPPVWRESYVSTRTAQSGVYEEIPAVCSSFENETYLLPVVLKKSCGENTYMSLV